MTEDNGVAKPQGNVLLARRLTVVPVADVGGLVEVEDQPWEVAREEDDDKAKKDHC